MKFLKRWPMACLLGLALLLPLPGHAASDDEPMDDDEALFDEIEVRRKEAEQEGAWELSKEAEIAISERVFTKPWNKPPFGTKAFDMTPAQIKANWPHMMRALQVPYPSAEYLKARFDKFPAFKKSYPGFDGNFEKLSAEVVDIWRLFMRGDFQDAMKAGEKLGVAGRIPGKLGQIMYAIYLEPNLEDKHMLLQDAANVVREYGASLDMMKKSKEFQDDYVMIRIGYAYAIGRIAEDVPIPVAIGRNYVFKVLGAANDILELQPDNPLGLAFRAGIDANVMRKVGKATGRVTFGAKTTDVNNYFDRALKAVPDVSVIRYEYANALLYMNKKRQVDEALKQLEMAAGHKPSFAMEALDAMYAAKRRKEVEAMAAWRGSFRSFERKRLAFQKKQNQNLYCVLPNICPPYLVK